ncbi:TonB-dependent receptor [Sphingopyxis sp. MC1]|uniref:TonB-dependent receptor n=1 Tax=Sphingopyxis sp. MC1 TaxID=1174684 RepID=UPI0002D15A10|nr:TonB-dependent receptor [Sphingopyxis sp. MC1]ENY80197.1 TonB-dependent receptor [Sphingopyxis sp. MC1]
MKRTTIAHSCVCVSVLSIFAAQGAWAQDATSGAAAKRGPETAAGLEPSGAPVNESEIIVTGSKRAVGQSVQNSALAVTALGSEQLQQANIQTISDLSAVIPNVNLNNQNTNPGVNNFSIRGMGIYSSIPSSTPTVGVFVDGVYLGANAGVALSNNFDIESIEVLRGPQGLLFGRNVTGGAILITTRKPTDELRISARAGIESGPNYTASALVSGPITANGVVSAKLGAFYNRDEGYFENIANGNDHLGQRKTTLVHGALALRPDGPGEAVLRFEYGKSNGDGVVSQNRFLFPDKDDFRVALNEEGFNNTEFTNVTLETNLYTAIGDGVITNIIGWRHVDSDSLGDIDSSPTPPTAHLAVYIRQQQLSDELRYAGTFGPVSATIGAFYYTDKLRYVETRDLATPNPLHLEGGGVQDSWTYAFFSNFDIAVTDKLTLMLGARYSKEHKKAVTQALSPSAACNTGDYSCPLVDFSGEETWDSFTPKLGLAFRPTDLTNIYGTYTKGFRSGGYNLRHVTKSAPPGPYDQEVADSFEIGWKQKLFDSRLRFRLAAFMNKFKDLQRDLAILDPVLGNIQTTVNTADVTIKGVEFEATYDVTDSLQLSGNVGYLDSKFDEIRIGFRNGGAVTPDQYDLELPYLSPWSYGASVLYRTEMGTNQVAARVSYQHIDSAFSNDINVYKLLPTDKIDANLSVGIGNTGLTVAVYGKNLLDKKNFGMNNPLFAGTSFTPLNKGRVLGAELRFEY